MPYTDPRGSAFASMPPLVNEDQRNLDHASEWMHQQSWYTELLAAWGQTPDRVHLSDAQKNRLVVEAQLHGLAFEGDYDRNGQPTGNEGRYEFDDAGNLQTQTHRTRKGLTAAAIVGGAIAGGYGASTLFSGAGTAGATTATGFSTGAGATGVTGTTGAALTAGGYGTTAAVGGTTAGVAAAGATTAGATTAGATTAGAGLGYGDLARYGIGLGGNLLSTYLQSRAASNATDAQQKYLEEALAYAKESDLYKRGIDANAVTLEANRYASYQDRIGPYIANGTSSNDRMAALLGLPARTTTAFSSGGSPGGAPRQIVPSPITANTSDPTNTPAPQTDPTLINSGTVHPSSAGGGVQMRAPDGSVNTVQPDQVAHYQSLGAVVIGAA